MHVLTIVTFFPFQEGYHTFRGGFWNYFSMGKISNLDNCIKHKCSCKAFCHILTIETSAGSGLYVAEKELRIEDRKMALPKD